MTPDYQTDKRMALKLQAIPLPDLQDKSVLDVGCDFGFWSFLAADRGASRVLGLDRGRDVKGHGVVDLAEMNRSRAGVRYPLEKVDFRKIDLGKQWREVGCFDVVFLFSLYHHLFANCGNHNAIWFWLWNHTAEMLLWENPVDDSDPVVRANVPDHLRPKYNRAEIFSAAERYFTAEPIGPALHEPTREVWRFIPKEPKEETITGQAQAGAGGAAKAFEYSDGRRSGEIRDILGYQPKAGSLNVWCDRPFDWSKDYYRSQILDVADRRLGLNSKWAPKWARFYPITVNGIQAHVFRFEGEAYNERFVELIAPVKLRDHLTSVDVTLCR
jgi:SAM-dependent methyltransferase